MRECIAVCAWCRVAHDTSELERAPTLDAYFFERIRPIMQRALKEQHRASWPVIVLNLDFKQNDLALLDAVYTLLGKYEPRLTTAAKTATPTVVEPRAVGPLLVLSGSNGAQRKRFHDAVPRGASWKQAGRRRPEPGRQQTPSASIRW